MYNYQALRVSKSIGNACEIDAPRPRNRPWGTSGPPKIEPGGFPIYRECETMAKVRLQGHLGRVLGELLRLRFAILVATWGARGPDAGPKIELLA